MPLDSATTSPAPPSVRRALRVATSDLHARLDRRVMGSDPFRDDVHYRAFLATHVEARRRLRSEFGTLVPTLDAVDDTAAADTALGADLARLGRHVALPLPERPPADEARLASIAGVHYVLEGSLLGARHLARELVTRLGDEAPRAYLDLGVDDPDRWQRACRRLETIGWSDEVERGALRAFEVHLELFGEAPVVIDD